MWFEGNLIALRESGAKYLRAGQSIVDLIRITNRPAVGGAKPPNCELNPAWKAGRKLGVELTCVDAGREPGDDIGTAARRVTSRSVNMLGIKATENAGPMQECVHEAVDRHEACSSRDPSFPLRVCAEQQLGQDHAPDFRPCASNVDERVNQGGLHRGRAIWRASPEIRGHQAIVDPLDDVIAADVTKEKREAEGSLVQGALSSRHLRKRTCGKQIQTRAGRCLLPVAASGEVPITSQLRTNRATGECVLDVVPTRAAVPPGERHRSCVADALPVEQANGPVEDRRGVVLLDSHLDTFIRESLFDILKICRRREQKRWPHDRDACFPALYRFA